jgi:hypothetical protein
MEETISFLAHGLASKRAVNPQSGTGGEVEGETRAHLVS